MGKTLDFCGLIWHIRIPGETDPAEEGVAGGKDTRFATLHPNHGSGKAIPPRHMTSHPDHRRRRRCT